MKKKLLTLDDETADLLAKYPNQSQVAREAIKLYLGYILPDNIDGMRAGYEKLFKQIKEIESKIDYLARKV